MGGVTLLFWAYCAIRVGLAVALESAPQAPFPRQLIRTFLFAYVFVLAAMLIAGAVGSLALLPLTFLHGTALFVATGSRARMRDRPTLTELRSRVASHPVPSAVALVALAIAASNSTWAVLTPLGHFDDFTYHLVFPVEWMQLGAISTKDIPFGNHSPPYYPKNGELVYTWALLPIREVFHLVGLQFLWVCIGALALYDLLRLCEIRARSAVTTAALFPLCPIVVSEQSSCYVDIAFAALFLLVVRGAVALRVEPCRCTWIEFALVSGAFAGTKIPGVALLVLIVAPASACLLAPRFRLLRTPRTLLVPAGLGLACALLTGGWWYVWNWLTTSNPVFPLIVEVLGVDIFDGAYGRSALPDSNLETLLDLYLTPILVLQAAGAATGLVVIASALRRSRASRVSLSSIGPLVIAGFLIPTALVFVFGTLMPFDYARFMIALYGLACVGLAISLNAIRRGAVFAELAVLLVVVACLGMEDTRSRLLARIALESRLLPSARVDTGFYLGCAALVGSALLVFLRLPPTARFSCSAIVAGAATALWLTGAETSNPTGVSAVPAVARFWEPSTFIDEHYEGVRIAGSGSPATFMLFGSRLTNRVRYINVQGDLESSFHDFVRNQPALRAANRDALNGRAYYRGNPSYEAWVANLDAWEADLFVAQRLPPWAIRAGFKHDASKFPLEVTWAERNPGRFRRVYNSPGVRIYAIDRR